MGLLTNVCKFTQGNFQLSGLQMSTGVHSNTLEVCEALKASQ